jgi:enoyl-CoA hydratase
MADSVTISGLGALALVTLDRPTSRNALTRSMRSQIAAAVPRWARDPGLYAVAIQSAVPGAFSAGGDVREIISLAASDPAEARGALAEEYTLNWLLECFSKPTVSLIDGIVMGTGAGISTFGTHRVAGENYAFAMPETAIGLFPDDGLAWVFARLADEVGMYLGLTGRRIGRADAFRLGLATHCVSRSNFAAIRDGLAGAEPVDPLLDGLHEDPGAAGIDRWRPVIARCFAADSVGGIRQRLAAETGEARDWAAAVIAELDRKSPLSLAVTHRHICEAAGRDLRQTLQLDYRLAAGFIEGHDFREGVRAALIDKDGAPRWQPATLTDVTPGMVDRLFHHRGSDELVLPTRQEMQAARV